MRSCLSFLLIPLFAFGAFPGRASTTSVAVQSESSARLSYLQGDVRISLGEQEEPEIGKKWIDASAGMPMHAGYSIATEDGTAEIELENGSVIYLAPRSLLMFYELATDDPDGTGTKEFDTVRLKLLTGSVMFLSQFRMDGEFILETQTARLRSDRSVLFRVTRWRPQAHTSRRGKGDLNIGCICDACVRYPVLLVKITKAVRINERHIEELEKLAKKEGETVSFLIQQAIREYLERKAAK